MLSCKELQEFKIIASKVLEGDPIKEKVLSVVDQKIKLDRIKSRFCTRLARHVWYKHKLRLIVDQLISDITKDYEIIPKK